MLFFPQLGLLFHLLLDTASEDGESRSTIGKVLEHSL